MTHNPFSTETPPERKGVLDWIDRHAAVFVVIGLLGLAAVGFELWQVQERQGSDEHATCVVQARGLPASKHLANVMRDIDVFLEPPDPKNPLARTLPKSPPVPPYYKPALDNLRIELPAYNRLEAKQPGGRKC